MEDALVAIILVSGIILAIVNATMDSNEWRERCARENKIAVASEHYGFACVEIKEFTK